MAQRRMFSKSITSSARFLRMPPTSRLLYYDLGMAADDEGIVEAFTVLRITGAAEDDLRVLASRRFIIVLNEELVSYITDWSVNNQIRKDRFTPSIYANLLIKLSDGNRTATGWQPDGTQMAPQFSIDKFSIEKDSSEKDSECRDHEADRSPRASCFSPPSVGEVAAYCQARQNGVDAQRFVDFYSSKGWKIGMNNMIDWQAAVRTWESREQPSSIRTADQYTYSEEESL